MSLSKAVQYLLLAVATKRCDSEETTDIGVDLEETINICEDSEEIMDTGPNSENTRETCVSSQEMVDTGASLDKTVDTGWIQLHLLWLLYTVQDIKKVICIMVFSGLC